MKLILEKEKMENIVALAEQVIDEAYDQSRFSVNNSCCFGDCEGGCTGCTGGCEGGCHGCTGAIWQ